MVVGSRFFDDVRVSGISSLLLFLAAVIVWQVVAQRLFSADLGVLNDLAHFRSDLANTRGQLGWRASLRIAAE